MLGFSRGLLSAQARIHLQECCLVLRGPRSEGVGVVEFFLSHNQNTPTCWDISSSQISYRIL